jgi:hypothetical protein
VKVDRSFFGMMYQGSSIDPEGRYATEPYYPIPIGVLRTWDTRAVMTFSNDGLASQVKFAESNNAEVMYTFGLSADPAFPPPADVLLPGSRNRPTRAFLTAAIDQVLDFSLADVRPRIRAYEEGNELSIADHYWDGSVEEAYDQCAFIYHRIKARDPSAVLLSPSLNALDLDYGLNFALKYVALMKKYGPACDAFATHVYTDTLDNLYVQLANFDRVRRDFPQLPYYCTEFNGPWEAFDVMAARGFKCVVLNGQQPPAPYYDEALCDRWQAMVDRLTTVGPSLPAAPASRKGCGRWFHRG